MKMYAIRVTSDKHYEYAHHDVTELVLNAYISLIRMYAPRRLKRAKISKQKDKRKLKKNDEAVGKT